MVQYPTNKRYEKRNMFRAGVALNRKTEPELVEWMEGIENRSEYLRELIRADMEAHKRQGK